MQEQPTTSESEPNHEHIPTRDEVLAQLKEVISDCYKIERERSDGEGLYLLEVIVQTEEDKKAGEYAVYGYARKGSYPEVKVTATEITVAFYNGKEFFAGKTFASYVDGEWVKT